MGAGSPRETGGGGAGVGGGSRGRLWFHPAAARPLRSRGRRLAPLPARPAASRRAPAPRRALAGAVLGTPAPTAAPSREPRCNFSSGGAEEGRIRPLLPDANASASVRGTEVRTEDREQPGSLAVGWGRLQRFPAVRCPLVAALCSQHAGFPHAPSTNRVVHRLRVTTTPGSLLLPGPKSEEAFRARLAV